MADTKQERFPDYPIFKGLQRPLEFFGLQGRYIYWAAATAGGAVAGFILGYCIFGFVAGLGLLVLAVAVGGVLIVMKQRKACTARRVTTAYSSMPIQRKCKTKKRESIMSKWNAINDCK